MTYIEKAQLRMDCLVQACNIKMAFNAHPEVKGNGEKDVIEIAKEFAAFVLNDKSEN